MPYKQPPRSPHDGAIGVDRITGGKLVISVETNGDTQSVICSEYNASRILGALAVILGVRLNSQDAKSIKM